MRLAMVSGELEEFYSNNDVNTLDIASGGTFRVQNALREYIFCVIEIGDASDYAALSDLYGENPQLMEELLYLQDRYDPELIAYSLEDLQYGGNWQEIQFALVASRYTHYDALYEALGDSASLAYSFTPIAGVEGAIVAAQNGDILGVFIEGVGVFPMGRLARITGRSSDEIAESLQDGARIQDEVIALLPPPSAIGSARRFEPGVASFGRDLPIIREGDVWLRGSQANAGRVPRQIAEALSGRNFSDFNAFRRAFWQEVANDPALASQFSASNITRMRTGRAPFTVGDQAVGARTRYELDHIQPLSQGGNVYDMDNLVIRTPLSHLYGR